MTDAAPRTSRRLPRLLPLVGVLVALLAVGWAVRHFVFERTGDTNIYATVQKGEIEDLVTATGSLQPRDYVDVGAQVSGQLKKIHVEVGSEVKEGDLLAEIDAEQSSARVEANQASLRSQQAQLGLQQVNLEKAERDLQRQKNLMTEEATTTELVQNAQTTVDTTRAQINSLKAQIQQLTASMRVEQANLRFTKILAPMSGTVVSITAKQGQTLNANQSAPIVLRIGDLSTMTVQTQVSEADVSKLRTGMNAYFTTLGGNGRRYYGKLKKVEPTPTVTNNVVLYNALFDVPNMNNALLPQMTAQVFFIIAEAHDVLVVPVSALTMARPTPPVGAGAGAGASTAPGAAPRNAGAPSGEGGQRAREGGQRQRDGQGQAQREGQGQREGGARAQRGPRKATVKLAQADGEIVTKEVTVGVTNRVHAEVLEGLAEGDRVVAGTKVEEKAAAGPQNNRNQNVGGPGGFPGGGFPGGGPR
ncbi:MAG: efflux RND transporter periplasmic adaptor subunit [Steroidobacteraceae bacterium]